MTSAAELLRPDVLTGLTVARTGTPVPGLDDALAGLGATVLPLEPGETDEAADAAVLALAAPPAVLVCCVPEDAGPVMGLDATWAAIRAVHAACWGDRGPGRLVLVLPRAGVAVRAAGENLVRTLSVEWARFGTTTVAVLPGPETSDAELCALLAFLCSPGAGYVSGTALTLR